MATQPAVAPVDARAARRPFRGTAAVLAGLVANVVLSLGIDQILHSTGVYPPWGQSMSGALFLLATAYRIVISIATCYLTARLAPDRPMWHALALGVVGVIASTGGLIAAWNNPAMGPRWYPVALVLVSIPCAWIGGRIRVAQLRAP